MKCFPEVSWALRIIHIVFTMAVIFINIVIAPYSGYHLPNKSRTDLSTTDSSISITDSSQTDSKVQPANHRLATSIQDFYPQARLNMSRETQDAIYSDILNTITSSTNELNRSQEHKPIPVVRETLKITSEPFSLLSNFKTEIISLKNHSEFSFRTNVILEPVSSETDSGFSERTDEDFLLGFSNNPFGSSSRYIKDVGTNSQVPRNLKGRANTRSPRSKRRKRSVVQLYNMVLCATGCDPLSYKGYGCYCGFLGSGYVVDGIDSCCKMHDWCYNTAGCPMFLEYFFPYLWKCYHRRPLCAIDHGSYGGPGSCAQRLCECDRQLAQCLRSYPCPSTKAICTSSPWRLFQNIFMHGLE